MSTVEITRRQLIRSLSVAAVGASVHQTLGFPTIPASPMLDVGFHGLWTFFERSDKSIVAVAPWNAEHCFLCGSHPGLMGMPNSIDIANSLSGSASLLPAGGSNFLAAPYVQGIEPAVWWTVITLPPPYDVHRNRPAQLKFKEDKNRRNGWLSFRLLYQIDPSNPPVIKQLPNWKPNWQDGAMLHFHAEPDHIVNSAHASAALEDMCGKLGLSLHVDPSSPPSATPPNPIPDDDATLGELGIKCTGGLGARTTASRGRPLAGMQNKDGSIVNCMPMVITGAP